MADQDDVSGQAATQGSTECRALTVVASTPASPHRDERPLSDFLAQLIACDRRLPAYRVARQAPPDRAALAYEGRPGLRAASLDCCV